MQLLLLLSSNPYLILISLRSIEVLFLLLLAILTAAFSSI